MFLLHTCELGSRFWEDKMPNKFALKIVVPSKLSCSEDSGNAEEDSSEEIDWDSYVCERKRSKSNKKVRFADVVFYSDGSEAVEKIVNPRCFDLESEDEAELVEDLRQLPLAQRIETYVERQMHLMVVE